MVYVGMVNARSLVTAAAAVVVLSGGLGGCGPAVLIDDGAASGTGISEQTTTGTTQGIPSGTGTDAGPSTTVPTGNSTVAPDTGNETGVGPVTTGGQETGPTIPCDGAPGCAVDCAEFACGEAGGWFDDEGCLRPTCGPDGTCGGGDVCFVPEQWGCPDGGVSCSERDGQCSCEVTRPCPGAFCAPAGTVPPTTCNEIADPSECTDAGCGPALLGRPIQSTNGGVCLCDLEQNYCVWVAPGGDVQAGTATPYYNLVTTEVVVFADRHDPAPLGWVACDERTVASAECECALVLPCAM